MDSVRTTAEPRVVVSIADSGVGKDGKPKRIEGPDSQNRSRFMVTLVGRGTYYWTPAEAEALFQALGSVLEPLGGEEEKEHA